jgi:hypothetical protein
MDAGMVYQQLVNWTVQHSGHREKRGYIGLSAIGECERAIYDNVHAGQKFGVDEHLRTRLSFELESALIERLKALKLYGEPEEIDLFNHAVQGHTDGLVGDAVLEIKTVSYDAHFPNGRLPERVYWQVQAYLHFLNRRQALVVYMARANGEIRVYPIWYNPKVGQQIVEKLERVTNAVLSYERPACTCGRCES